MPPQENAAPPPPELVVVCSSKTPSPDVTETVVAETVVAPETKVVDFDDVLPHLGEFGIYQKLLFLLLAPFAFFVCFVYFAQIFITIVPENHWCLVPELLNMTVEER